MNKIIITGYLGQDPEMQTLSNGAEKCRFTVGVSRRVKKDAPKKDGLVQLRRMGRYGRLREELVQKGQRDHRYRADGVEPE